MKREIKFRGKSKKYGNWLYGYLGESKFRILNTEYCEKIIFNNVLSFNSDNYSFIVNDISVDPDTVGQYTGLKDKNGIEICEDDIISARGIILTVKYIGGVFFACNVDSNIDKYPLYILCEWENESGCEIIGNIHNNPELLKTK